MEGDGKYFLIILENIISIIAHVICLHSKVAEDNQTSSTVLEKKDLTGLHTFVRSAIHGRGLFCKRNIEAGEMVIEYAGIVIRAVLTDKREKYYDGKVGFCHLEPCSHLN